MSIQTTNLVFRVCRSSRYPNLTILSAILTPFVLWVFISPSFAQRVDSKNPAERFERLEVNLQENDLSKRDQNDVSQKLNSTLVGFIRIAEHAFGLKNVRIGQDFSRQTDGSYSFEFDDPLGKIPQRVTIPALSSGVVERADHFHSRFLLLCALEMACFQASDRYETVEKLGPQSYRIDTFSVKASDKTVAILLALKSAIDSANEKVLASVDTDLNRMINRTPDKAHFPFREFEIPTGKMYGEEAVDLLERMGRLFLQMQTDPELNKQISNEDIELFSRLMFSPRDNEFRFLNLDYSAEVRVHVDPVGASRLQSYQRVYRHVTGRDQIPKLYGVLTSLQKEPGFLVRQNAESDALLLPYERVIYDCGRISNKTTTGMLAMDNIYHLEDFADHGLRYYPKSRLPDMGAALSSAYFFAVGFEAPDGRVEAVIDTEEFQRSRVKLVDDRFVRNLTAKSRHFETYTQAEVIEKNEKRKIRGPERIFLYNQAVKEGWSNADGEVNRDKRYGIRIDQR